MDGTDRTANEELANFDLLAAPGHLLRRNHQRSYDIFKKYVGSDITRQQFALLLALNKHPNAAQKDLVSATGIDKSTLKEMLGRMIARGWVLRDRDQKDNRAWTMRITPDGLSVLKTHVSGVAAAQREILAPLSPSERATFLRYLRILVGMDGAKES